jgi:hypothetical protein
MYVLESNRRAVNLRQYREGTFGYTGRARVRGGGVQSMIYQAGGDNPTARFFYAELPKRF